MSAAVTQHRKIAAYAKTSFVNLFPHLMGSPVNVAAFVHFAASIPNYAIMESGSPFLNEIVDIPPVVEAGHIAVSDRPGLGIQLREEVLHKYPYRPHRIRG